MVPDLLHQVVAIAEAAVVLHLQADLQEEINEREINEI